MGLTTKRRRREIHGSPDLTTRGRHAGTGDRIAHETYRRSEENGAQ